MIASAKPFLISSCDLPGLRREAVTYAMHQLADRAGVPDEMQRTWRIEFAPAHIDVYIVPGSKKRVRFPRIGASRWNQIRAGVSSTSTASWPEGARTAGGSSENDFKIPFSSSERSLIGPLFYRQSDDCFECALDLPVSALLTLSRFEETVPTSRDSHGRFCAHSSVAWRDGFLHRPIVDEYGLAFEQVLRTLLCGWPPAARRLRVKLSHDVDEIGIPFSLRSALSKTLRHGRPWQTVRDLSAALLGTSTTYQVELERIAQFSLERGLDTAVYWKASSPGDYDTGYDPGHPGIQRTLKRLLDRGVEMGIHPSYATFHSLELLQAEVATLRQILGQQRLGGRQDYLRWSPQTWAHWDGLGLAYDGSVGFADHVGFRAGTCFPYRPWLWSAECTANLVEIPLLAMDSTLQGYMKLTPQQSLTQLRSIVARCRAVGGVFSLAWHNTRIMDRRLAEVYVTILDELQGSPTVDWRKCRS